MNGGSYLNFMDLRGVVLMKNTELPHLMCFMIRFYLIYQNLKLNTPSRYQRDTLYGIIRYALRKIGKYIGSFIILRFLYKVLKHTS